MGGGPRVFFRDRPAGPPAGRPGGGLIRTFHPPVLRRARVLSVSRRAGTAELELLDGPLSGETVPGVFYEHLGGPPVEGEVVEANAVGLEMGLGTGGIAVIPPSPKPKAAGDAPGVPPNGDHFVKLPYTPLQFPAPPPPQAESLLGVPVVVLPLHSHLAPACCAAAAGGPGRRVAFVWQEGGALPVALSETVRELKERGLLHTVVSAGGCFGGDVEAPNVYSGLLAAAFPEAAAGPPDLVVAGIGPGVVGTATAHGHGGMSAAIALNAASALLAEPVLAPRLSRADGRGRHRGLSHHTRAALGAALAGCRVAVPRSYGEIFGALPEGLPGRHRYETVGGSAAGLEDLFGVTFRSMGRGYAEDPIFFDAAAAAVALAMGTMGDGPQGSGERAG